MTSEFIRIKTVHEAIHYVNVSKILYIERTSVASANGKSVPASRVIMEQEENGTNFLIEESPVSLLRRINA